MRARLLLAIVLIFIFPSVPAEAAKGRGFWQHCLAFVGLGEPDLPLAELSEYRRPIEEIVGAGSAREMVGRAVAHVVALKHLLPREKARRLDKLFLQILHRQFQQGWRFFYHEYDGGWIYYGRADRMIRVGRDGEVYKVESVPPELFRTEEEDRYTPPGSEYLDRVAKGVTWKKL